MALPTIVIATTFFADLVVPQHITIAGVYCAAVALTINASQTGILAAVVMTCFLTALGSFIPSPTEFATPSMDTDTSDLLNRCLAVFSILTTGMLTNHIYTAVRAGREDQLTRVYNRRGMEAELAARTTKPTGAILIDIDDFKRINDTWGLLVGDIVLREVAEMLTTVARSTDLICRYGGDEFLVLLSDATVPQARKIAERIFRLLSNARIEVNEDGAYVRITASLGVSPLTCEVTVGEAVRRTQHALKQSKGGGKNCVTFIDLNGATVSTDDITPVPSSFEALEEPSSRHSTRSSAS